MCFIAMFHNGQEIFLLHNHTRYKYSAQNEAFGQETDVKITNSQSCYSPISKAQFSTANTGNESNES